MVDERHGPASDEASPHTVPELATPRLLLRAWRDEDLAPFAAINADARVARHLPRTLTRDESDTLAGLIRQSFARDGVGLWAVERTDLDARPFIGFIGLSIPRFEAHFTPCVELGWRLAPEHWGLGLATEGARMAARHAFEEVGLDAVVAFTVPANAPSRRVMEKIGMRHDPSEDFDHPALPEGDALRRHVLYRLDRARARAAALIG